MYLEKLRENFCKYAIPPLRVMHHVATGMK